jgi:RNA polymerase sigma factor (sigma-70 family)
MILGTEETLMMTCRQGNKDAFFELVQPLLQRAYTTSAAILRSAHAAEEAVQNALVEAYSAIIRDKEIRNFTSWFNHLVACRALDLARQRTRHGSRIEDIDQMAISDAADSPFDAVLKKEQGSELLQSVMALDIHHRTVIILFYYQELSIEEIAQVLELKKGTVKSRLHAARLKLSQIVPQHFRKQVIGC